MLDHLTVSSACFGDAPLAASFRFGCGGHALVDFERFLSELSCGFSCCCFFLFFFFFIHFLSYFLFPFLFLGGDFELFFFLEK